MLLGSTCILCAALCGVSEHQSQDTLRSWDTLRSQIHLVPIKETQNAHSTALLGSTAMASAHKGGTPAPPSAPGYEWSREVVRR